MPAPRTNRIERMSPIDRVYLMIRMLKENYDKELTNLQRKKIGVNNRSLSLDEKHECEEGAKGMVCQIGISMYGFEKFLYTRYEKTIEYEAIHRAVDMGIEQGLLQWSVPRRFDPEKGGVQPNIILTEKGFEFIKTPGSNIALTMAHLAYMPKLRRRRI